ASRSAAAGLATLDQAPPIPAHSARRPRATRASVWPRNPVSGSPRIRNRSSRRMLEGGRPATVAPNSRGPLATVNLTPCQTGRYGLAGCGGERQGAPDISTARTMRKHLSSNPLPVRHPHRTLAVIVVGSAALAAAALA